MASNEGVLGNAPATICIRCKHTPLTSLKCVSCGSVVHPSCAKYLKQVKILNDKQMNCCESKIQDMLSTKADLDDSASSVKDEEDITTQPECMLLEISYLKELLKQKDLLIASQQVTIDSLIGQITLMTSDKSKTNDEASCNKEINRTSTYKLKEKKVKPTV